jgi:hypothetical protein
MYYSEFMRIRSMERLLERLAYFSVGLDFLVAIATFLLIKGYSFSQEMLTIGGYLLFVEVVIAAILFISMVGLRHFKKAMTRIDIITFKSRYRKQSKFSGLKAILARLFPFLPFYD